MEKKQLFKIEKGDLVWVENRWRKRRMQTVVRVTNTQIILNGDRQYNAYKRETGYAYGRSWSWDSEHIAGRVTKADLAKQEAEQARKQAADDAEAKEQERERDIQKERSDLFTGDVNVQGYTCGDRRVQCYAIHGLSDAQVRIIAAFMKRQKKGRK